MKHQSRCSRRKRIRSGIALELNYRRGILEKDLRAKLLRLFLLSLFHACAYERGWFHRHHFYAVENLSRMSCDLKVYKCDSKRAEARTFSTSLGIAIFVKFEAFLFRKIEQTKLKPPADVKVSLVIVTWTD